MEICSPSQNIRLLFPPWLLTTLVPSSPNPASFSLSHSHLALDASNSYLTRALRPSSFGRSREYTLVAYQHHSTSCIYAFRLRRGISVLWERESEIGGVKSRDYSLPRDRARFSIPILERARAKFSGLYIEPNFARFRRVRKAGNEARLYMASGVFTRRGRQVERPFSIFFYCLGGVVVSFYLLTRKHVFPSSFFLPPSR